MAIDWSKYPEKFWHCYVELAGSKAFSLSVGDQRQLAGGRDSLDNYSPDYADGVLNDLTLDQLRSQVIEPWLQGRPFDVGGVIVKSVSEVSRIGVVQTDQVQRRYAEDWEIEEEPRSILHDTVNLRMVPFWPRKSTKDYTDEFLLSDGPPVTALPPEVAKGPPAKALIVHGHDTAVLNDVASVLERLDIEAVILMEPEHRGRILIEKSSSANRRLDPLWDAYTPIGANISSESDVAYCIILFAPDDVGRAKDEDILNPRARQNSVLELGYFIGAIGRERICVLNAGDVEMPSDLHGVGYHDIDAGGAWKLTLAKDMRAAGLPVDLNNL